MTINNKKSEILFQSINQENMKKLCFLLSREPQYVDENDQYLNMTNTQGQTALHIAIQKGNSTAIKLLLRFGANALIEDNNGKTALFLALNSNESKIIRPFLHWKDASKNTAAHYAAIYGKSLAMKTLKNLKADLNACNRIHYAPIHFAASKGHVQVINTLSTLKAKIDAKDIMGWTALHCAALFGKSNIIKDLRSLGLNINDQDIDKNTPLHLAIQEKHSNTIKTLVAVGANCTFANHKGETAMNLLLQFDKQLFDEIRAIVNQRIYNRLNSFVKILQICIPNFFGARRLVQK